MSQTSVQNFTADGTWTKPDGAERVEVSLKGGSGHPSASGKGGQGGDSTYISALGLLAGGGGGGGGSGYADASARPASAAGAVHLPTAGGEGGEVTDSYDAADLPATMHVKVGRPGGYAVITTYLGAGDDGDGSRAPG